MTEAEKRPAGEPAPGAEDPKKPKVEENLAAKPEAEAEAEQVTATKRPAEAASAGSPDEKRLKTTPPEQAVVKKQIEYYFSDVNLRHDKFFHEKISADPEGWLDAALLLSCNKVKAMKATKADLLGALKDSELETKEEGEKAFVRRKGNAKLPSLEARPSSFAQKKKQSTAHDGGVMFQVKNIPEEETWLKVKEAIAKQLPEGVNVWFVSSVNDNKTCMVALAPFDQDVEFVSTKLKLNLGGTEQPVEVCYGDTLVQALKMLPKGHRERREKAAKTRQKARQRPILLAGQKFVNLNTIRGKVKEILSSRTDGEELKVGGPDYTLVRAIMEYHPAKERKLAGMRGIKVDVSEHGSSRCFWILREEGKGPNEDFSIKKCIEEIDKNPPYADAPKDAAAGSTASAAGSKDDKKAECEAASESPKKEKAKAEEKKADEEKQGEDTAADKKAEA